VEALEGLVAGGAIRRWGVSNFDPADMRELQDLLGGAVGASARAPACAANQVYYSLGARGIEFDLLPQLQRSGIAAMAYSPLDQGALGRHPGLRALAQSHGVDPATLALAWVLRQPGMCAVPKAVGSAHLRANFEALRWAAQPAAQLQGVWQALDRMFAPPTRARPLAML
jgi:diketogulonate reductase-like aldo/keto reductase